MRPEHEKALDQVRAEICRQLKRDWPIRCRGAQLGSCTSELRCPWCKRVRDLVTQLRALDTLRAEYREAAFMREFWMLRACGLSREEALEKARADRDERGDGGREDGR